MTPNELTLRDFARTLRQRGRSPKTIKSYLEAAEQLAARYPDREVTALTRREVEAYLLDVLERFTASTAATRFRALQQLYRWAMEEELVEVSPMARMHPPSIPDKPVEVLSMEALRALLAACDGREFPERRDTAIVRLFLEPGGLRLAELANLAVSDVDLAGDVVTVLGKGRRQRSIPFGARTGNALTRYARLRERLPQATSTFWWLGAKGRLSDSGVAQVITRRAEQAGLGHVHPHQLRHTAAHYWLAAGGAEGDAMRLFGWRSPQMLQRYGAMMADDRAHDSARRLAIGDRL